MPYDGWGNAGDAFCQNLLAIAQKYKELRQKLKDLKKTLTELKRLLAGGFSAIADVVGAEIISAASTLASQIVSTVLSAASGAVAAVMERILSQLLTILMAGPEELLALIGLPLIEARKNTLKERNLLNRANSNLSVILSIISKWVSGFAGDRFYQKMKNALPNIEEALIQIASMISDLDVDPEGNASPYFSRDKYNRIIAEINEAIQDTEPDSVIGEALGFGQTYEEERRKYIGAKNSQLQAEYNRRRRLIDDDRREKINDLMTRYNQGVQEGGGIVNSAQGFVDERRKEIQLTNIDAEWEWKVQQLDSEFELKRQEVEAQSITVLPSAVRSGVDAFQLEFNRDLNRLRTNLIEMLDNIKDAAISYKKSQVFTNSTYKAIDSLRDIIKWFIDLASKIGGGSSDVALGALRVSQSILQGTQVTFEQDIEKYLQDGISATKMSTDLTIGNTELKIAQSTLSGLITESLIKLINLDESLGEDFTRFQNFQRRIEAIPDWDGKTGVWGVNLENAAISPYIGLVADITRLVGKAPIQMASPRNSDKQALAKSVREVRNQFSDLLAHNSTVLTTLQTYTPQQSDRVNILKQYLDALGFSYLSYAFVALSLVDMAEGIKNGILTFSDKAFDCFDSGKTSAESTEAAEAQSAAEDLNNQTKTNINNNSAEIRMEMTEDEKDRKEEVNRESDANNYIPDQGAPTDHGSGMESNEQQYVQAVESDKYEQRPA